MGINTINPLLKEIAPSAFMKIPLSTFSGKSIAIDAHILIYKYISFGTKSVVNIMNNPLDYIDKVKIRKIAIEKVIEFNKLLFDHYITPVWVFDGKPIESKMKCLKERKEAKNKKIENIETEKTRLAEINPLKITQKDFDELKRKISSNISISMDDITEIKNVISSLGIPIFIANGDGEKLCSSLNREGIVSAVWSIDTDNIALGTPIMIKEICEKINGQVYIEIIRVENILSELNVSLQFITDLCIMLGCDFNDNIPKIGQKRAYELMKQYGSIDFLPDMYKSIKLDREILNYHFCREIFSYEKSGIHKNQIIMNWDDYLINIEEIVERYVVNNKQKYTNFIGWEIKSKLEKI